ncbi:ribosome recycling factor [Myxococcota bacterium]|nr:ribosome recycling factor [Myxococcota bacterium]
MIDDVLSNLREENSDTLNALTNDLAKLRTGRANLAILDGIRVNYYGSPTELNQCANLAVADARMIVVKPFDRTIIGDIEKAILQSDVGINPQNDGDVIRLPIPALTEERRKELAKQAKQRGEDARIAMRNHRRDSNEMLKDLEKDKEISQDDLKRGLEQVQKVTDESIGKIGTILEKKEKEILEV